MCLTIIIMISSQSSLPFSAATTMSLCSPYWLLYATFSTLCFTSHSLPTTQRKHKTIAPKHVFKTSLKCLFISSSKLLCFQRFHSTYKATISPSLKIIVTVESLFLNLYCGIWLKLKKKKHSYFSKELCLF